MQLLITLCYSTRPSATMILTQNIFIEQFRKKLSPIGCNDNFVVKNTTVIQDLKESLWYVYFDFMWSIKSWQYNCIIESSSLNILTIVIKLHLIQKKSKFFFKKTNYTKLFFKTKWHCAQPMRDGLTFMDIKGLNVLVRLLQWWIPTLGYNWKPRHVYELLITHWGAITQFVFIWLPRLIIWTQIDGCDVKNIPYLYTSNLQGPAMTHKRSGNVGRQAEKITYKILPYDS